MIYNQKNDFISFMVNSRITSDHLKFLRTLELFSKNKLNFKSIIFFNLAMRAGKIFPRRIQVDPNHKTSKIVFSPEILKNLKRKPFFLEKDKVWFLIGKDPTGFYIAQG